MTWEAVLFFAGLGTVGVVAFCMWRVPDTSLGIVAQRQQHQGRQGGAWASW